ncbi:MAG: hypothetical protein ACLT3I_00935, partial [Ruminococcus sp.]
MWESTNFFSDFFEIRLFARMKQEKERKKRKNLFFLEKTPVLLLTNQAGFAIIRTVHLNSQEIEDRASLLYLL